VFLLVLRSFLTYPQYTVGKYYTPSGRCIQATNYSTASVTPALPTPPPPLIPVTPAPPSNPTTPVPLIPPSEGGETGSAIPSPITDASSVIAPVIAPPAEAPTGTPGAPPAPGVPSPTPGSPVPSTAPDTRPALPSSRPLGAPTSAYSSRTITESERKDFRTAAGRLVRDGGGIEADVPVDSPPPSDLEGALRAEAAFFYYAAEYAAGLPTGAREALPDDFEVTDEMYADFVAWVTNNAVVSDGRPALASSSSAAAGAPASVKTADAGGRSKAGAPSAALRAPPAIKLESRFVEAYAQLEEALRSAGYDSAVASVGALKDATAAELVADFSRHEPALRKALDDAIRQRLQPDSDRMVAALENDEALRVALDVVRNGDRYASVLRPPTVTFAGGEGVSGGGKPAAEGQIARLPEGPR